MLFGGRTLSPHLIWHVKHEHLICSSFYHKRIYLVHMLGILVQLLLSWIIVWSVEKRDLSVLGFMPTKRRVSGFFLFFFLTSFFCASAFILKMMVADQRWHLNPLMSAKLIWDGLIWNIQSVLFEELIFRGVILYILIKRLGTAKGVIISAIGFGIYHWFSFNVIGNVPAMVFAFLTTGTMGLLLAYAYAKTCSLYIPIAIHLGWNFTQIFVFSQGPIGNGILITDAPPFRTNSYLVFFGITFMPMIMMMLINYLLIKKRNVSSTVVMGNSKVIQSENIC
jgi:uncharacterized protein